MLNLNQKISHKFQFYLPNQKPAPPFPSIHRKFFSKLRRIPRRWSPEQNNPKCVLYSSLILRSFVALICIVVERNFVIVNFWWLRKWILQEFFRCWQVSIRSTSYYLSPENSTHRELQELRRFCKRRYSCFRISLLCRQTY